MSEASGWAVSRDSRGGTAPDGGTLGIGEVLARLQDDFPDISISKIRFLETEGLVLPERTPSGYRRFRENDIDRLHFVLTAQRDRYLPLKVIRDQLRARDLQRKSQPAQSQDIVVDLRTAPTPLVTRDDLKAAARGDEAFLASLEEHGLVRASAEDADGPLYAASCVRIVEVARRMRGYGIEPRHLRGVRTAADRQAGIIEQAVRSLRPGTRTDAAKVDGASRTREDASADLQALSIDLQAAMLAGSLAPSSV